MSDTVILSVSVCSSVSVFLFGFLCLHVSVHLCLYFCSCHSLCSYFCCLFLFTCLSLCSSFSVSPHMSLSVYFYLCASSYTKFLTYCASFAVCLPVYVHPSLSLSMAPLSLSLCLSVCLSVSLSLNTPPPTSQVTVPLFYNCPRYLTMPYVCLLASRSSLGHVIRTIWHRAGSLSLPRELVLGRWCPLGGTGPPHDQSHNRASSAQVPNTSYQTDSKKVPHGSHSTVSTCCSSRRAR